MPPPPPPRRPGLAPLSPTTHPAPFAALAQVVVSSQRHRRMPIGPTVEAAVGPARGPCRPQRQPDARSGGSRGPRRSCQHGWRASGARGALGGQRCRREAASRAPRKQLMPVRSRWREIVAVRRPRRAGRGFRRAGAGLVVANGQAEAEWRCGGAVRVLPRPHICIFAIYGLFRDCARSCGRCGCMLWFQCIPMFLL